MKDNSEMTREELIALGWVKNPLDKMQEKTEKLTAVEWFWNEIAEVIPFTVDSTTAIKMYDKLQEAKEMEKEALAIIRKFVKEFDEQVEVSWNTRDEAHNFLNNL